MNHDAEQKLKRNTAYEQFHWLFDPAHFEWTFEILSQELYLRYIDNTKIYDKVPHDKMTKQTTQLKLGNKMA